MLLPVKYRIVVCSAEPMADEAKYQRVLVAHTDALIDVVAA